MPHATVPVFSLGPSCSFLHLYAPYFLQALDSCSALLLVVEPSATRMVTQDGAATPRGGAPGSARGTHGGAGGGPGVPHGLGGDTQATVYVLHDRLLGARLPPYKVALSQVRAGSACTRRGRGAHACCMCSELQNVVAMCCAAVLQTCACLHFSY